MNPPNARLRRLRSALRCPACAGILRDGADALLCEGCGESYPFVAGRPVLLAPASRCPVEAYLATEDGRRMLAEYSGDTPAGFAPALRRGWRLPDVMLRYFDGLADSPARPLFAPRGGEPPLVLNVGGGPRRESVDEITLNIGPFRNVDIVGDGHHIPVANATFDGVFSLAVLEHVPDAPRVVSEMLRVLKPGGWLYSEVPFIFFFHGYPSDYQRYTLEGMKRLFAGLEDARFGMTHGPVSAALQCGKMALQLLLPPRPRLLRKAFNGTYRLVLFPLKYLDLLLRDRAEAHVMAGGFYVIGRKPLGPRA
jgi:SAM-dependent methyltransferase